MFLNLTQFYLQPFRIWFQAQNWCSIMNWIWRLLLEMVRRIYLEWVQEKVQKYVKKMVRNKGRVSLTTSPPDVGREPLQMYITAVLCACVSVSLFCCSHLPKAHFSSSSFVIVFIVFNQKDLIIIGTSAHTWDVYHSHKNILGDFRGIYFSSLVLWSLFHSFLFSNNEKKQ